MIYETQEQLNEALTLWQERLQLRDWTIRATLVSPRELEDADGDIHVHIPLKAAFIRICTEQHDKAKLITEMDQERALVHELIHIHMEPLWPEDAATDSLEWRMAEQATQALTLSVIAAWHQDLAAGRKVIQGA